MFKTIIGMSGLAAATTVCEPQDHGCCTSNSDCTTEWGQLECASGVCAFPGVNATAVRPQFAVWKAQFNRTFSDLQEHEHRLVIWAQHNEMISAHNQRAKRGEVTYFMAHNQFSAFTKQEFRATMLSSFVPRVDGSPQEESYGAAADSIDWVAKGAVTGVKDQGQCGSCWAFSTTGSVEGALFTQFNTLTPLSEQQLVSCDHVKGPQGPQDGCNGGYMDAAFDWIGTQGGICSEKDYPYKSGSGDSGVCKKGCTLVPNTGVVSHIDVNHTDAGMLAALNIRPVSIAIEADQSGFQFYSSGVFTGACGTSLDHGVLAVGYGADAGVDYYKVKNSWAATWGMKGYINLGRGSKYGKDGQCGLLINAAYPTLKAATPTTPPPPSPPTAAPPPTPAPVDHCAVAAKDRVACPTYETDQDKCLAQGCCFDNTDITALWCFVPKP